MQQHLGWCSLLLQEITFFLIYSLGHWEGKSFCLLTADSVTWELGQNEKIIYNSAFSLLKRKSGLKNYIFCCCFFFLKETYTWITDKWNAGKYTLIYDCGYFFMLVVISIDICNWQCPITSFFQTFLVLLKIFLGGVYSWAFIISTLLGYGYP